MTLRSLGGGPDSGGQWSSTVRQKLMEPKRFVAIVMAPVLLDDGRKVSCGFFCHGCWGGTGNKTIHYRIKYTIEEAQGHIAGYGQIIEKDPSYPGTFVHVKSA